MRVVWQRQKAEGSGSRIQLTAVLEVDGEGRQQAVMTQLGSIEERFLETRIRCTREFHQGLFWKAVDQQLEFLGLEPHCRNALEQEISHKVPRPGDEWALWGVTCIPRFDAP
jgi:hypothetical protein